MSSEWFTDRSVTYPGCKVCLISNVEMYNIKNSKLLQIYEKLTSTKFDTEDGRIQSICYICLSQLRRSYRFSDMAQKSQKILDDLLYQRVQARPADIKNNLITAHNLSVSPVSTWSLLDDSSQRNIESGEPIAMKDKNTKSILDESDTEQTASPIKVEKMTDSEELIEIKIECVPFEDNYTDTKSFHTEENFDEKNQFSTHLCDPLTHLNDIGQPSRSPNLGEFPCNICNKIFCRKQHLNAHMRIHIGEKPFSCDSCLMSFYDRKSMERHMRTHTGEKPYGCEACTKTFSQAGSLQKHIRTHTGEKPFICTICLKTFAEKSSLQAHVRVHTGEKPYACKLCNKTYTQATTLRVHMRSHTGEKPYACQCCNKTFAKNSNYVRHMRSHTGDMPHACTVCPKTFSSNYDLQNHMRIHTGEKPYVCPVCGKSFTQKSNLCGHMRIHSGVKPFACTECDKTFYHKNNMKKHLKKHVDSICD